MVLEQIRRPAPIGVRGGVLLGLLALALWGCVYLGLGPRDLIPGDAGLQVVMRFFARAISPALTSEAAFVPPDAPPLLLGALEAAGTTLMFAAAAMGVAVVLGLILGFLASTAWWAGDPAGGRSLGGVMLRRTVAPLGYVVARTVIAVMRSVHEILWAVLFLAAFGLNDLGVVLAIAIPYGGTLAKIFSEMVDEAPRDAARALRGAGGTGVQVFGVGLVSRALPDMSAYTFYRFECALRSSAVLGFFGFETLGLYIRQSFKSGNYGEVWTYLYLLIAMIVLFDWWSGALRRRIVSPKTSSRVGGAASPSRRNVRELWKSRPRDRFVRVSLMVFVALLTVPWVAGGFDFADAFSAQRAANFERFLAEVRPFPLQGQDWDWGIAAAWAGDLLDDRGYRAALSTLAISLVAIVLAALAGLLLALPAARNFATAEPFAPAGRPPSTARAWFWRSVVALTRFLLTLLRALPEYIWAFLLIAMLGPTAWPAVLALAVHNAGILGRLDAETVENVDTRSLVALRGLGARRSQIAAVALFPAVLPRLLLYFFYRWETCVREATVLGMLGVVSLGYWIEDARTRGQHDNLVFLILLGAVIVLVGDLVSAVARRMVRSAS